MLIKLLQDKTFESKFEVLSASGYSPALSKVRTLLIVEHKKFLLVPDTDTNDVNEIKQEEAFVNTYVDTNNNKRNFKAVWAIPEFKMMFLNKKKFLHVLTEKKFSEELLKVGKSSLRAALESISNQPREQFLLFLDSKESGTNFLKKP